MYTEGSVSWIIGFEATYLYTNLNVLFAFHPSLEELSLLSRRLGLITLRISGQDRAIDPAFTGPGVSVLVNARGNKIHWPRFRYDDLIFMAPMRTGRTLLHRHVVGNNANSELGFNKGRYM